MLTPTPVSHCWGQDDVPITTESHLDASPLLSLCLSQGDYFSAQPRAVPFPKPLFSLSFPEVLKEAEILHFSNILSSMLFFKEVENCSPYTHKREPDSIYPLPSPPPHVLSV